MLGEFHGIAETANAVLALTRQLDARALGFEWSYDETDAVVQGLFTSGRIDLDALWEIPAGGDLFAGDGRFTAGLVRVLEELVATGELEQVILFDRLGDESAVPDDREAEMAARLVEHVSPGRPTLALTGYYHASREAFGGAQPMLMHLERERPGIASGLLAFSTGHSHSRKEQAVRPAERSLDVAFELGHATPAVVPAK